MAAGAEQRLRHKSKHGLKQIQDTRYSKLRTFNGKLDQQM
jgi:hypothetical protein